MTRPAGRGIVAITACLLMLLAACGDDDSGGTDAASDTGTDGGEAGSVEEVAQAAQERVDPFLQPADSIGIDGSLDGEVPQDVSVYWLEGNIQSILPITTGFEGATDAIGWDLTTITYDPADPQGPSAAMRQAVDGGADYIAISGQTIEILGESLDAAKSAGIPVIDLYSTDEIGGEANGVYANVGSAAYSETSFPLLVDYIIADSGGDAQVLFVNIPDFAILQIAADATNAQFESECPDCVVTPLDVTINDLTSGAVASQVVSQLQSNPNIDYVFTSIGDLATGLPEALAGAGLAEQAQIVTHVPNPEQIQAVADGTIVAAIPLPRPESAWSAVDAMARLELGMEIDQESHELLPIEVWTPDNVPTPAEEYEGPEGYQDQFTELWGVSG
jgi:ABC-type sugar transport system substrate-binding protein